MLCAMGQNRFEGRDVDFGVRGNCISPSGVKLLERVRRVTREHHVPTRVVDADHRYVARRVTGRVDSDDASVIADWPALQERPKRSTVEHERLGIESGRQRLTQEAAHDPWHRRYLGTPIRSH